MDYNYHAHTFRCRHATGTEEEYIQRAIANGVKYMGFSDHSPFRFPDGFESGHRVLTCEIASYFETLKALREKYKDQIDLKIGFEMEYYPAHFSDMFNLVRDSGAEYLILGQHFIGNEHPDGTYSYRTTDNEALFIEYTDCSVAGIESGVFTYLAHPDLMGFSGDPAVYDREVRRLCRASIENHIPLEINFYGIRDGRQYPRREFWKIAGEEKAPVTFGFDAHDTLSAYDGESLKTAEKIVKDFNLNYIGRPKIIELPK